MIPSEVNWIGLLNELNGLGVKDANIEYACGLTSGYVAQIRCGNVKKPDYEKGAKLVNLLDEEMKE